MSYDLGDLVPLTATVRDPAGTPVVPATVTLTIELPDGTTVTPSVTPANPVAYDYSPTMPGRHAYRIASTGPQAAYADVFDVRAALPGYIISLADARRVLKLSSSTHDEELRGVVEAVTSVIEDYTGKTIVRRTVVDYHTLDGAAEVWLDHRPVISVTSIATTDAATSWVVADLDLDPRWGRLTVRAGNRFTGRLAVTYVAGMTQIPANYTEAAEIIVQHMWASQRGSGGSPRVGGLETPGEGITTHGSPLPLLARELLGSRPPMVA